MEEIVIGAPCDATGCALNREIGNGHCGQTGGAYLPSDGEGITVADANANVQTTEDGALLESALRDEGSEVLIEDRDVMRSEDEPLEGQEDGIAAINSGKCCCCDCQGDCQTKGTSKDGKSFSAVEFVLPDDGNKLSYIGRELFHKNKSNIKQVVAKVELHIKYYDGYKTNEVVIPAGTRGGYVSANADFNSSWISENSIVLGMSVSNCYIDYSEINSNGYLKDSTIIKCQCRYCFHLEVNESSLLSITIKGSRSDCAVFKSHLSGGCLENSKIDKCDGLCNFEIVDSSVETVHNVNNLIVDGACISNIYNDLLQITNVGTSNRTVCAYKTHRGGVRVSTGCFRGTLDELIIANAKTHLGYNKSDDGYLIKGNGHINRRDEWCYTEYDMLIKYIKHHFKLDVNTMTIPTKY